MVNLHFRASEGAHTILQVQEIITIARQFSFRAVKYNNKKSYKGELQL